MSTATYVKRETIPANVSVKVLESHLVFSTIPLNRWPKGRLECLHREVSSGDCVLFLTENKVSRLVETVALDICFVGGSLVLKRDIIDKHQKGWPEPTASFKIKFGASVETSIREEVTRMGFKDIQSVTHRKTLPSVVERDPRKYPELPSTYGMQYYEVTVSSIDYNRTHNGIRFGPNSFLWKKQ